MPGTWPPGFSEPERLRPGQTTATLTEAAAVSFSGLAQALRAPTPI